MRHIRVLWRLAILLTSLVLVSAASGGSGSMINPEESLDAKSFSLPKSEPSIRLALDTFHLPQPGPFLEDGEPGEKRLVVKAYYRDPEMVKTLAARNEPWEVNLTQSYVVVDVTPQEYQWLESLGFTLVVDETLTAQINQPVKLIEGQLSGIPGYPCYRTVEETFTSAVQIVNDHPTLAAWIDIGDSWEKAIPGGEPGYDLMVLRLTNSAISGDKPRLFAMSSVHAREFTPAELMTRFAEYMVSSYGTNPDVTWLLDYHDIHLLLQANPDGRKQAETGLSWRKNTNANYCTVYPIYRGADLNRNYSFEWGCCGGSSGSPCDLTYRGPSAASEPETQAVENYVRSLFPDQRSDDLISPAPVDSTGVFLDMHSYSELVLWSWGFTDAPPPNSTGLTTLGRKLAYFNNYKPQQSMSLYPTDGTTDDFAYGELGIAAYTFELGTSFNQDCSIFENTIVPTNLPALVYAAKAARTPYLSPGGPDALNVTAALIPSADGAAVHFSALLDDTRYGSRNGTEPTHNIVEAEYYIDVPPWSDSLTPQAFPLTAADGTFDSNSEAVQGAVDAAGLSRGRHIVYVRGKDASGAWGMVTAAFFNISETLYFPLLIVGEGMDPGAR